MMAESMIRDQTRPQGKWAFDGEVARVFDDMLARSIPQYETMRGLDFDLVCRSPFGSTQPPF